MISVLLVLLALQCFGADILEIPSRLEEMVNLDGKEYLEARNEIVGFGEGALPRLAQAAVDDTLEWPRRLAARICYERILRGTDIEAFIGRDWERIIYDAIPEYKPDPNPIVATYEGEVVPDVVTFKPGDKIIPLTGATGYIRKDFIRDCEEMGTWYYFIELNWKQTNEVPKQKKYIGLNEDWPRWCADVVRKQPEKIWICRVLVEKLVHGNFQQNNKYICGKIYDQLLKDKEAWTVPVLLDYFDEFIDMETRSLKKGYTYIITVQGVMENILDFADSRHVEQLEMVMRQYPELTSLMEKLEEVRTLPKPIEPDLRQAFRIEQEAIVTPK